jgi:hypothetical protein
MAGTESWREVPVLEAILRLNRTGRIATPERIAEEAILHLGNVYDSVAALVSAGYVEIDEAVSENASDSTIVISLAEPVRALLYFGPLGAGLDGRNCCDGNRK